MRELMNEETLNRIEKKVDLLYKIVLHLGGTVGDSYYEEDFFDRFMNQLIPLFNVTTEKEIIKIPNAEELQREETKIGEELNRLKKDYENGNYIAKEENILKRKIENLTDDLEALSGISECREDLEKLNQEVYELRLFHDLKRKVGLHDMKNFIRIKSYLTKYFDVVKVKNTLDKEGISLLFDD